MVAQKKINSDKQVKAEFVVDITASVVFSYATTLGSHFPKFNLLPGEF